MTGPSVPTVTTEAACWCGLGYVELPVREVRDGLTRACARPGCVEEDRRRRNEPPASLPAPERAPTGIDPAGLIATIDTLGELPELLRAERKRRGLDQFSAARQIGIGREGLVDIELRRGPRGPSMRNLLLVLAWLVDDRSRVLKEAAA